MSNNTYEGDVGIKYNFVKNDDETEEKKTDDIFAGGFNDDENDAADVTDFTDERDDDAPFHSGVTHLFDADEESPFEKGFSVVSDSERKYSWEKPPYTGEAYVNPEYIPKPQKAQKTRRRGTDAEDDEYYDLEIGSSSVGLKILMSLMLITFIVIISILIYKLNDLNDKYQETLVQLDSMPTTQQLEEAEAEIQNKDQEIKQLNAELGKYKVENADLGDLIVAEDGTWYVVADNDTLGQIAQKYGVSVTQIKELNNLDNADHIRVGQRLKIKEPEAEAAEETAE